MQPFRIFFWVDLLVFSSILLFSSAESKFESYNGNVLPILHPLNSNAISQPDGKERNKAVFNRRRRSDVVSYSPKEEAAYLEEIMSKLKQPTKQFEDQTKIEPEARWKYWQKGKREVHAFENPDDYSAPQTDLQRPYDSDFCNNIMVKLYKFVSATQPQPHWIRGKRQANDLKNSKMQADVRRQNELDFCKDIVNRFKTLLFANQAKLETSDVYSSPEDLRRQYKSDFCKDIVSTLKFISGSRKQMRSDTPEHKPLRTTWQRGKGETNDIENSIENLPQENLRKKSEANFCRETVNRFKKIFFASPKAVESSSRRKSWQRVKRDLSAFQNSDVLSQQNLKEEGNQRKKRSSDFSNPKKSGSGGPKNQESDSWEEYVDKIYKLSFSSQNQTKPKVVHRPRPTYKKRARTDSTAFQNVTKTNTTGSTGPVEFKKGARSALNAPVKYDFVFDPTNRKEECRCGTNGVIHVRVVGGTDADVNEFPWQVGLFTWNRGLFCGGSLVNNRYVITAAHCVANKTQDVIKAILADHDLSTNMESKSKSIKVTEIIIHPDYASSVYTNDIAILKLSTDLKFSDTIRPPCFLQPGSDYSSSLTIVSGWGATEEGQPSHPILQKATLPVIDLEKCKEAYGDIIGDTVMCVGGIAGRDACQGDSGGPLVKTDSVRHFLIGVVSWGSGCGNADLPGVYTRVDKFYDWIYQTTKEGKYCK